MTLWTSLASPGHTNTGMRRYGTPAVLVAVLLGLPAARRRNDGGPFTH